MLWFYCTSFDLADVAVLFSFYTQAETKMKKAGITIKIMTFNSFWNFQVFVDKFLSKGCFTSLFICSAEEYKLVVEKREIIRNEFHDKMVDASKVCYYY